MLRRGVPVRRVGERLVTTVYDLLLAQYGVARPRPARRVAGGLRRRRASPTRPPGRSGSPASRGGRVARGPRVRAQRGGHRGPVHDHHGLGHQPLVQLRHDLPHDHDAALRLRLHRSQRRRLGALRRAGEGAPLHGLGDARLGARLEPSPAPELRHASGTTWPPTSGATRSSAPTTWPRRWPAACLPARRRSTRWPRRSGSAGRSPIRPSTAIRSRSPRRRRPPA